VAVDVSISSRNERGLAIAATDGELLMQFVRHSDEHAFREIVERHGRLVWMLCRQILWHRQDVEDAFQATFLILAQRAGTIRAGDSAAAWLYKVAQRTALAARRKRSQRREEELRAEPPLGEEALPMIHDRQMQHVLMEELATLPQRYRTPLVLRYLEGRSRRAIAEQTDSTVGQIQGRLARARRMLRSRLMRRGVSLSVAAAAATSATSSPACAALTPAMIETTAGNCLSLIKTGGASAATSTALQLAKEGVKTMWIASIAKTTTAAGALVAAGIVWAAQQGGDNAAKARADRPANAVQLSAAADAHAPDDSQTAVFVADASGPPNTTAKEDEQRERLQKEIDALGDVLDEINANKAKTAAELEIEELDKYLLKQELDFAHQTVNRLKASLVTSPDAKLADGSQQALEKQVEQAMQIFLDAKDRFKRELRHTAEMSPELERLERERANIQRRLEQATQLATQLDFQQLESFAQAAPDRPSRAATGGRSLPPVGRPQAESYGGSSATDESVIGPHDSIRIQVLNAFPDQPIADDFTVEPMGTVALGPSYGRVKVAGLTVLEAEEAIKRHLSEIIEKPVLQVTIVFKSERPRTTHALPDNATKITDRFIPARLTDEQFQQAVAAQFDELQRELAKLQAEHAGPQQQLDGGMGSGESLPTRPDSSVPNNAEDASAEAQAPERLSIVTRYESFDEFQQAVARQLEQVKRERDALQKENADLKKQLEQFKMATSALPDAAAEEFIQPGDQVLVAYETKAAGANAGPQFFTLNRDGDITIELGGGSPPRTIRIGGMDSVQAAEQLDREVGHLIDNIRVERVTAPR
jgi:RNA polymerase sigma factor (sigma-70 family)